MSENELKGDDLTKKTFDTDSLTLKKNELRLNDILDIAAEVFREQGYEATSVGEIARRARASKDTFYRRYPTKEELFKAVVLRKTEPIADHFRSIFAKNSPIDVTLTAFARALIEMLLTPESIDRLRIVSMESKRFPIVGAEFYNGGPKRVCALLAAYIEALQKAGSFRQTDSALAAEQFVEMVSASPVRRALLGVTAAVVVEEDRRRIKAAVKLFMAGYVD